MPRSSQTIADHIPSEMPFGHGYTYSDHPVSAAVGLEVLRLYTVGGILANGQVTGVYFEQRLVELLAHSLVGDVRARGMLAGVELVTDIDVLMERLRKTLGITAKTSHIGHGCESKSRSSLHSLSQNEREVWARRNVKKHCGCQKRRPVKE